MDGQAGSGVNPNTSVYSSMPYGTGGTGANDLLYLILGGFLFDGNGRRNNCEGPSPYIQGVNDGQKADYKDIVNSTQSVLQSIGSNADRITNVSRTGSEQILASNAQIRNDIKDSNYANLLSFKDQQALIIDENQKTRQQISALELKQTQDELNSVTRQRDLLATGNWPITRPGHIDYWQGNAPINQAQNIDVTSIQTAVGQGIAQAIPNLVSAMQNVGK
jgi:hypothetical protein